MGSTDAVEQIPHTGGGSSPKENSSSPDGIPNSQDITTSRQTTDSSDERSEADDSDGSLTSNSTAPDEQVVDPRFLALCVNRNGKVMLEEIEVPNRFQTRTFLSASRKHTAVVVVGAPNRHS